MALTLEEVQGLQHLVKRPRKSGEKEELTSLRLAWIGCSIFLTSASLRSRSREMSSELCTPTTPQHTSPYAERWSEKSGRTLPEMLVELSRRSSAAVPRWKRARVAYDGKDQSRMRRTAAGHRRTTWWLK